MAAAKGLHSVQALTQDYHVWPDLHGNRSPLADPSIKGMICGLTMSASIDNLALTYLGFVQALAVSYLHCVSAPKLFSGIIIHNLIVHTVRNTPHPRSIGGERPQAIQVDSDLRRPAEEPVVRGNARRCMRPARPGARRGRDGSGRISNAGSMRRKHIPHPRGGIQANGQQMCGDPTEPAIALISRAQVSRFPRIGQRPNEIPANDATISGSREHILMYKTM